MSGVKRVLIIDDDPSVRETVELVLISEGYEVLTAGDGETGVELAKKYVPSAIILDVTMPKMNGYLVATLISQDPQLKHIPIMLLTGTAQMVGSVTLNIPGMHSKLDKPFDHEEMLNLVNDMVRQNS